MAEENFRAWNLYLYRAATSSALCPANPCVANVSPLCRLGRIIIAARRSMRSEQSAMHTVLCAVDIAHYTKR